MNGVYGSWGPCSYPRLPPETRCLGSRSSAPPLLRTAMMHYISWLVLAVAPTIFAQSENANCTDLPTFNWVYNSKSQSPCTVAEDLANTCDHNGFTLPPITSNGSYNGPTADQNNNCHCTSILYSLISACAACQYGTWISWTEYTQNCTGSVYLTVYPVTVPSDTGVPHWAYLDVTATNNTFDPSMASSAGGHESTAGATATGPTSARSTSKSSHSSKLGAGGIAGAVLGSILGVLLIAALLYALYRWRKKRATSNVVDINDAKSEVGDMTDIQPVRASPLSLPTVSSPPLSSPGTSPPPLSENQPRKYYDPDDPTTHPDAIFGRVSSLTDQSQGYPGYAEPG